MRRRYVVVGITFDRFCGEKDFYSDIATFSNCATRGGTYSLMP